MRQRQILRYSSPFALLAFCWLTMGVTSAFEGEAAVTGYGFPLTWYSPNLVSSGSYEIAIGPMLIDFAIYHLLSHALWSALFKHRLAIAALAGRTTSGSLWTGATVSVALWVFAFSIDPVVSWWNLSSSSYFTEKANHRRFVSVGLRPRPRE